MNNSADKQCKPSIFDHDTVSKNFDVMSLVGLVIWFACVLYSSIRVANNSQVSKLTMSEKILMKDNSNGKFPSPFYFHLSVEIFVLCLLFLLCIFKSQADRELF